MYREYALDPAALSTWEQVRFFLSHIGPWCGRFIAMYPRAWKRHVYNGLNCPDLERSRIEEGLRQLDARVFTPRTGAPYDGSKSWLENARLEHDREPFAAIVAPSPGPAGTIGATEVGDHHPKWALDRGQLVPRDATAYLRAVSLLLRCSRHLVVVDQYFCADTPEKQAPLAAFCGGLSPGATVEVHVGTKKVSYLHHRTVTERYLPALLPAGLQLVVKVVQQRTGGPRFHNRYLLTEIGGLQFGDSLEQGAPGETDRVSLLEESSRAELWSQYVAPGCAFDSLGPPIAITGTGRGPR